MDRTVIEGSSNIAEVGYDPANQVLEIKFHNGSIYQYQPVPPHLHRGMLRAESQGKYFGKYIRKNPKITYNRMDDLQVH